MSPKDQDACSPTASTVALSPKEPDSGSSDESTGLSRSSSGEPLDAQGKRQAQGQPAEPAAYDPDLWYIHGQSYDLRGFVDKHPGGRLAILSGRGRDCTALFESYHPWNDRHRRVLQAFGPKPPPPDPFFEEIKERVREAFPGGGKTTKMRPHVLAALLGLWSVMVLLFFFVQTPLACLAAGAIMATVGTRLAHEGAHFQISGKEWVNRLCLFLGYFCTGPSMAWHYRHVMSHHTYTNQEEDVDVMYIWMADMLPSWVKALVLPGLPVGAVIEIGPKAIVDMLLLRKVGGCRVDVRIGGLVLECLVWVLVHWNFGPSWLGYLCFWWMAGAIFVPCSQVAHAILFPKPQEYASWAQMQIIESCDFAVDSDFWYHLAFGLTTQVEHHLFPGIGHHCYDTIRLIVEEVCRKHGVPYRSVSAREAFKALWRRWAFAEVMALAS